MSELTINTTQNVAINFKAASVGDRILASLLDLLIKVAYVIVVAFILFKLLHIDRLFSNVHDSWSIGAFFIIILFPVFIYSVTLESIFEGQTFGKKIIKIKVVKIDGYQASFGDYLTRWIFRLVENNILGGFIGLVAMILNNKTQRMGDMAAGTAVISLKNNVNISHTILEEIGETYIPVYPLVIKLSDNDMRIIKETFLIAQKKKDSETIEKLVTKVETVMGTKNQSGNAADFIRTILKDYNFYTQNM